MKELLAKELAALKAQGLAFISPRCRAVWIPSHLSSLGGIALSVFGLA
jgi:hypothetical protein